MLFSLSSVKLWWANNEEGHMMMFKEFMSNWSEQYVVKDCGVAKPLKVHVKAARDHWSGRQYT